MTDADDFTGLPDATKHVIRDVYWNVVFNAIDAIFVFTGRERFGKSTLAMNVWLFIELLRKEWGLSPTFDGKKVALIPEQYGKTIDESEGVAGDVVMYDEAGTGMYNRESMGKSNISINKILMTCGYKGLFHLVCLPNFFALDKEVRSRRVAMLFVVTARAIPVEFQGRTYHKLQKGWFKMYSAKDVQEIWKDEKTGKIHYPPTRFPQLFYQQLKEEPEWLEYEEASLKHKHEYIAAIVRELSGGKGFKDKHLYRKVAAGIEKLKDFDVDVDDDENESDNRVI